MMLEDHRLRATGSAVVVEGTVVVSIVSGDGSLLATTYTTSSKGGPERGTWVLDVELPPSAAAIRFSEELMEHDAPNDMRVATAAVPRVVAG